MDSIVTAFARDVLRLKELPVELRLRSPKGVNYREQQWMDRSPKRSQVCLDVVRRRAHDILILGDRTAR
ncbi:hypothetical protein EYF80_029777 [Liparis tanakae]|uniref:Uncharacterized protein n=1 Tax=Liparis tanakae TaxID=230148 RepID=A0A4Z2H2L9_9TELE|nr:hypothetical protein EYF80_029777 [Liparis tanakae]